VIRALVAAAALVLGPAAAPVHAGDHTLVCYLPVRR